jgi:hypothetical protein
LGKKTNKVRIKFKPSANIEHHQCAGFREGDWIIYLCEQCNYELRDNSRTGELIVRNAKPEINHSGSYFPYPYRQAFESLN